MLDEANTTFVSCNMLWDISKQDSRHSNLNLLVPRFVFNGGITVTLCCPLWRYWEQRLRVEKLNTWSIINVYNFQLGLALQYEFRITISDQYTLVFTRTLSYMQAVFMLDLWLWTKQSIVSHPLHPRYSWQISKSLATANSKHDIWKLNWIWISNRQDPFGYCNVWDFP